MSASSPLSASPEAAEQAHDTLEGWKSAVQKFLSGIDLKDSVEIQTLRRQFLPLEPDDLRFVCKGAPMRSLILSSCGLSDSDVIELLASASTNNSLIFVDLSFNPLTDAVAASVVRSPIEFLAQRPNAEAFRVTGTKISSANQAAITSAVAKPAPLDLSLLLRPSSASPDHGPLSPGDKKDSSSKLPLSARSKKEKEEEKKARKPASLSPRSSPSSSSSSLSSTGSSSNSLPGLTASMIVPPPASAPSPSSAVSPRGASPPSESHMALSASISSLQKKEQDLQSRVMAQMSQLSSLVQQGQETAAALAQLKKSTARLALKEQELKANIAALERRQEKAEKSESKNTPHAKNQSFLGRKKTEIKVDLKNVNMGEALSARGGSGATVYACDVDGWACACKELGIDSSGDLEGMEREIELLENLPYHKNIVKYLFHERTDKKLRMFMTRYHSNLSSFLQKREGRLFTGAELKKILIEIVRGLDFLHKHNIIHRDLKTDNVFIMLDERKQIRQLAIGDFDVSKKVSASTHAKTVIGTPYIMAPEVYMKKDGGYGFKADIYSFGMVVYEVLTLQHPFHNKKMFEIPDLITSGVLPEIPPNILEDSQYATAIQVHRTCVALKDSDRPDITRIKEMLVE